MVYQCTRCNKAFSRDKQAFLRHSKSQCSVSLNVVVEAVRESDHQDEVSLPKSSQNFQEENLELQLLQEPIVEDPGKLLFLDSVSDVDSNIGDDERSPEVKQVNAEELYDPLDDVRRQRKANKVNDGLYDQQAQNPLQDAENYLSSANIPFWRTQRQPIKAVINRGLPNFTHVSDFLPKSIKRLFTFVEKDKRRGFLPQTLNDARGGAYHMFIPRNIHGRVPRLRYARARDLLQGLNELSYVQFPWNSIASQIRYRLFNGGQLNFRLGTCLACCSLVVNLNSLLIKTPLQRQSTSQIYSRIVNKNNAAFKEIQDQKENAAILFNGLVYSTFCKQKYDKYRSQFPKLTEGDLVNKVRKQFDRLTWKQKRIYVHQLQGSDLFREGWHADQNQLNGIISARLTVFFKKYDNYLTHLKICNHCSCFSESVRLTTRTGLISYFEIIRPVIEYIYRHYTPDMVNRYETLSTKDLRLNLFELLRGPLQVPWESSDSYIRKEFQSKLNNLIQNQSKDSEITWTGETFKYREKCDKLVMVYCFTDVRRVRFSRKENNVYITAYYLDDQKPFVISHYESIGRNMIRMLTIKPDSQAHETRAKLFKFVQGLIQDDLATKEQTNALFRDPMRV